MLKQICGHSTHLSLKLRNKSQEIQTLFAISLFSSLLFSFDEKFDQFLGINEKQITFDLRK